MCLYRSRSVRAATCALRLTRLCTERNVIFHDAFFVFTAAPSGPKSAFPGGGNDAGLG